MSITSITVATLCVLAAIRPNLSLTSREASLFESDGIQVVQGSDAYGDVTVGTNADGTHTLTSNGFPDNAVATFPNDNNPYPILEQGFTMRFPQNPTMNEEPTCLPASSIIGFATNGVAIFSPFDADGNDLNIDFGGNCQGRTSIGGIYYYAQFPDKCSTFSRKDRDILYGVAVDGFPIYGPGSGDTKITNADLDACHGMTVNGQYRYYMTDEWPYVLGCFRGTPVTVTGAPSASGECKFACNKAAQSNDVTCVDDFASPTTNAPITTLESSESTTATQGAYRNDYNHTGSSTGLIVGLLTIIFTVISL